MLKTYYGLLFGVLMNIPLNKKIIFLEYYAHHSKVKERQELLQKTMAKKAKIDLENLTRKEKIKNIQDAHEMERQKKMVAQEEKNDQRLLFLKSTPTLNLNII